LICQTPGHLAKDCPARLPRNCFNCGKEGHLGKDCPIPDKRGPQNCHKCLQPGHKAIACPLSPQVCLNCHQPGHKAISCPLSSGIGNVTNYTQQTNIPQIGICPTSASSFAYNDIQSHTRKYHGI